MDLGLLIRAPGGKLAPPPQRLAYKDNVEPNNNAHVEKNAVSEVNCAVDECR